MCFASASPVGVTDALFPDVLSVMHYIQGNIHNGWTTSVVFQSPSWDEPGCIYFMTGKHTHQMESGLSDVRCTAVLAQRVPGLSYEEGKRRDGAMVVDAGLDFHWKLVQLPAELLVESTV